MTALKPQPPPPSPLDIWFLRLKEVMRANGFSEKALRRLCPRDWEGYYSDGYTPAEAFREDMSYAD